VRHKTGYGITPAGVIVLCGAKSYVQYGEAVPVHEALHPRWRNLSAARNYGIENYSVESQERMSLLRCHDGLRLGMLGSNFLQERSVLRFISRSI
jgi:hypothetical protein